MTSSDVDRRDWEQRALSELPEVSELQDRVFPFRRAVSFTSIFVSEVDEVQNGNEEATSTLLSRKEVLQLVAQHLELLGLSESLSKLQDEVHLSYESPYLNESRLVHYLKEALRTTDNIFDTVIGDRESEMQDVEGVFYDLNLVMDELEADDAPIWEEEHGADSILYYKEKYGGRGGGSSEIEVGSSMDHISAPKDEQGRSIKAFSLNRLVEHLTKTNGVDHHLLSTVLMTYQTFISPQLFLVKLIDRYNVPERLSKKEAASIQLQVCNVIKNWIRTYPHDFSPTVKRILQDWSTTLSYKPHALTITTSLARLIKGRKVNTYTGSAPNAVVPKNIFSSSLSLRDISNEELSRQLCLLQFDIYKRIKPVELLRQAWSKPKLKHRAKNVLEFITHFNILSSWAATTILRCPSLTLRTKAFIRMIKIAHYLDKVNNYNGLTAILAALNSASVHRLKFTKQGIPEKWLEERKRLENIMSRDRSFNTYRSTIGNVDPPCLPYLGLYLTDLTFIDENPDYYEHNGRQLISFNKLELQYNVISKLQQYQLVGYNFQRVEQIQKLLNSLQVLTSEELYQLSLKHEPRNCTKLDLVT